LPLFTEEDDHLRLGLRVRVVAEEDLAVYAAIRAFLLLDGPRADEAERPPLELVFVPLNNEGNSLMPFLFTSPAQTLLCISPRTTVHERR
jgi:hypothetical protein